MSKLLNPREVYDPYYLPATGRLTLQWILRDLKTFLLPTERTNVEICYVRGGFIW
jgi:hypothetical protein